MIKRIIWSDFAETQLDKIFDYYKRKASKRVATNLVKGIINAPKRLIKTPYIGQEEKLLKNRKIQYRYLVLKTTNSSIPSTKKSELSKLQMFLIHGKTRQK